MKMEGRFLLDELGSSGFFIDNISPRSMEESIWVHWNFCSGALGLIRPEVKFRLVQPSNRGHLLVVVASLYCSSRESAIRLELDGLEVLEGSIGKSVPSHLSDHSVSYHKFARHILDSSQSLGTLYS